MMGRSMFTFPPELTKGQAWEAILELPNPILGKQIVTTNYVYAGPQQHDIPKDRRGKAPNQVEHAGQDQPPGLDVPAMSVERLAAAGEGRIDEPAQQRAERQFGDTYDPAGPLLAIRSHAGSRTKTGLRTKLSGTVPSSRRPAQGCVVDLGGRWGPNSVRYCVALGGMAQDESATAVESRHAATISRTIV